MIPVHLPQIGDRGRPPQSKTRNAGSETAAPTYRFDAASGTIAAAAIALIAATFGVPLLGALL